MRTGFRHQLSLRKSALSSKKLLKRPPCLHVDGLLENRLTGPSFSLDSAVLAHVDDGNDAAKAQEGASSFDAGGAHKKLLTPLDFLRVIHPGEGIHAKIAQICDRDAGEALRVDSKLFFEIPSWRFRCFSASRKGVKQ